MNKTKREELAKKLKKLQESQLKLRDQLTAIIKKTADIEQEVVSEFGAGHHVVNKNTIVIVNKIVKKGRESISWRNVADGTRLSVPEIKDWLVKKSYDQKTAERFCTRLLKQFDKMKTKHTKAPEEKTVYTAKVTEPS